LGERSGVGLVELAILEALAARHALPDRRPVKCLKLLLALENEIGLARGYAYQVLTDLALPWKIPIPLIEPQGNFGSRDSDPPASPFYTEARLSPAGNVALAAERGEIAPVPIGLINGNTHRQGTRPPFRPAAVIDAIRQILRRPRITGRQILDIVGPPDFMTGCAVTGDLAGLFAGQRTELGLQARVTVTDAAHFDARPTGAGHRDRRLMGSLGRDPSRPFIVLDNFPPYVCTDDIAMSIQKRAEEYAWKARHPELAKQTGLPIKDLIDLSTSDDYWFVCVPYDGTPAEVLRDQLLGVRGITDYVSVGLPRPLATMIRTWTRGHQHDDLHASLTALESALAPRRQRRLRRGIEPGRPELDAGHRDLVPARPAAGHYDRRRGDGWRPTARQPASVRRRNRSNGWCYAGLTTLTCGSVGRQG
jgi:hypothetical protein